MFGGGSLRQICCDPLSALPCVYTGAAPTTFGKELHTIQMLGMTSRGVSSFARLHLGKGNSFDFLPLATTITLKSRWPSWRRFTLGGMRGVSIVRRWRTLTGMKPTARSRGRVPGYELRHIHQIDYFI